MSMSVVLRFGIKRSPPTPFRPALGVLFRAPPPFLPAIVLNFVGKSAGILNSNSLFLPGDKSRPELEDLLRP